MLLARSADLYASSRSWVRDIKGDRSYHEILPPDKNGDSPTLIIADPKSGNKYRS